MERQLAFLKALMQPSPDAAPSRSSSAKDDRNGASSVEAEATAKKASTNGANPPGRYIRRAKRASSSEREATPPLRRPSSRVARPGGRQVEDEGAESQTHSEPAPAREALSPGRLSPRGVIGGPPPGE
jgi:hypothetical protein